MFTVDENRTASADRPDVHHNQEQQRFELDVEGDQPAHLDYRRDGDTLVYHHTFVPEAARGQGLAGRIVRVGLEYARDMNLKVVPSCPYVAGYIDRNPEFREIVKE